MNSSYNPTFGSLVDIPYFRHDDRELFIVDHACLPLCSFAQVCEGHSPQAGTPELAYATSRSPCGTGRRSGLPWGVLTTTGPLGMAQAALHFIHPQRKRLGIAAKESRLARVSLELLLVGHRFLWLSPRLTLNLMGEEKLHSHTETVCGTTTSAPILKYSGDHYLGRATTPSVNRLVSMIQSSQKGYPIY
uniref:Uncharacterized protein n=1 Tax=Ananas comosus var. bracteatus TaxID=296719 RepID=A0A6V7PL29_ANACO|nr:unnamed protein product [Ananas comosus var. bracteatus]